MINTEIPSDKQKNSVEIFRSCVQNVYEYYCFVSIIMKTGLKTVEKFPEVSARLSSQKSSFEDVIVFTTSSLLACTTPLLVKNEQFNPYGRSRVVRG